MAQKRQRRHLGWTLTIGWSEVGEDAETTVQLKHQKEVFFFTRRFKTPFEMDPDSKEYGAYALYFIANDLREHLSTEQTELLLLWANDLGLYRIMRQIQGAPVQEGP